MNHNMAPIQLSDALQKYSNYAQEKDLAAVAKQLHSDGEEQKYTALLLMKMHTALPGGRWCGGERPECGLNSRSVKII